MSEASFVSIMTPVYNGADYIRQCVESVLKQTHTNFEYIIVNNCSTDGTIDILKEYANKDSRVIVHDNEQFLDVMANHNLGFRMVSPQSKYVKVVSADDWIIPECVAKLMEHADANPSVGVVGSYSCAGHKVVFDGLEFEQTVVNGHEACRDTLLGKYYAFGAPSSLLYRGDLVRDCEAFFPGKSPHADTSGVYQALERSDFGFVHQVLSYTRVHAQSQTSRSLKFGSLKHALLADIVRFGPRYLSSEDYERVSKNALNKYYAWLAPALIEHSLSKEFLEEQRVGLRAIGVELSMAKLVQAFGMRGIEFVTTPALTVNRITRTLRRRGKIEARYYFDD
jgi:glycosyltransferase involved in cell wall biosynthesis